MPRIVPILLLLFSILTANGQNEARLPADLRQHNLTTYNASLFNPAFSLDRNNPQSIAFWSRWQWQDIDADPTTIFLNYTRKLNNKSAGGLAFFQQNTGIYFNTGGSLNYAHRLEFNSLVKLAFGLNVFAFKQTLADDRLQPNPDLPLPLPAVADDFILQMAPGISLSVERLTLSIASENLFDYNFSAKESNTDKEDKIFMSLLSYDFPLALGSVPNAFLRPSMYLRTIPGQSNQVGFYTLLNTNKYWGQVGYNNFYGYAFGLGGTFFKHLSLGALVEFGTGSSINRKTSFELMAAYFLGKPDERHKVVGFDVDEENALLELERQQDAEEVVKEELEKEEEFAVEEKIDEQKVDEEKQGREREKMVQDSITKAQKEAAVVAKKLRKQQEKEAREQAKKEEALAKAKEKEEKRKEKVNEKVKEEEAVADAERQEQTRKLDSINAAKEAEALAEAQKLAQKRKQDSLIAAAQEARRQATLEAKKKAEAEAKKKAEEAQIATQEQDKPKEGEKYEEVETEDGLQPGYYLIANVFGTKKYFDAFMADLRQKGIKPGSFLRGKNNYNYAYLERFDTMGEARAARDNNYGGKYSGKTWIFRVVSE